MNKKIEELALQCGAWHQVYDQKRFMVDRKFDVEKFAELIVLECAKRVDYWESRQGEHCDDLLKIFRS
jgi:hypothetical protein